MFTVDAFAHQKVEQTRKHAKASSSKGDAPKTWHGWLDDLHVQLTAEPLMKAESFSGRQNLLSWQTSWPTLRAALQKDLLAYLCWGIPPSGRAAFALKHLILPRAQHILVNDQTTAEEIESLTGKAPQLVPFFIDTEFFSFSNYESRQDFLFCNGVNDRDVDIIIGLAEAGHKVVWLVNDAALREQYSNVPRLELVHHLPYPDLRTLYQTCRAYIMPNSVDWHCAGQTTGLEALSCGAPVLINRSRTADIFQPAPSVNVVETNTLEDWGVSLQSLISMPDLQEKIEMSRTWVQRHCAPDKLMKQVAQILFPSVPLAETPK